MSRVRTSFNEIKCYMLTQCKLGLMRKMNNEIEKNIMLEKINNYD